MISVIGACEQWAAKIAVDAIQEVCPAGVPETGLGLLGDEDEAQSVTRAAARRSRLLAPSWGAYEAHNDCKVQRGFLTYHRGKA
jgi:hypothetical protein